MRCRFPLSQIPQWAKVYRKPSDDKAVENVGAATKPRGVLSQNQLLILAKWKSPRIVSMVAKNKEEEVQALTRFALSTPVERLTDRVPHPTPRRRLADG